MRNFLLIFTLAVLGFIASLFLTFLLVSGLEDHKCYVYAGNTGRKVKYDFWAPGETCYVHTSNGWFTKSQIRDVQ